MKRQRCIEKPELFCSKSISCRDCMVRLDKMIQKRDGQEQLAKALSGEQLMPIITALDQQKPDSIIKGVGILVRGQWEVYQEQERN